MGQLPGKGDHAVPQHSVQQSLSEWLCLALTFQNNYRGNVHSVCNFILAFSTGNSNITVNRHDFSLVGFHRNYSAYQ